MQAMRTSKELTITNPLVLYRTLLACNHIKPDPAQHRLAIQLEKLHLRLKDYAPEIDYRRQLRKFETHFRKKDAVNQSVETTEKPLGLLSSLRLRRADVDHLALVKAWSNPESAINASSPQGFFLHGDVGTGKSMIIDKCGFGCLPNRRKRRWHFSAFLLDIFNRLEKHRLERISNAALARDFDDEHSLVSIATDLVTTSPIIFLDEFQLPDRASSRMLTCLLTSFFSQGGVLIATSNRIPEELANASGISFSPPLRNKFSVAGINEWFLGNARRKSDTVSCDSDFGVFYDVLRARCEFWNIEGRKDWRRHENGIEISRLNHASSESTATNNFDNPSSETCGAEETLSRIPKFYHLMLGEPRQEDHSLEPDEKWHQAVLNALALSTDDFESFESLSSVPWKQERIKVYGRTIMIEKAFNRVSVWRFQDLCASRLGPADYTSLASTFHTFVLTDVPVLPLPMKNEARRFITFLDALYESRCKLFIRAAAGPDGIFFPEAKALQQHCSDNKNGEYPKSDIIHTETFSEIYQDQTAPFRPNTSRYEPSASLPDYGTTSQANVRVRGSNTQASSLRSVLADEDSDFGPMYGIGISRKSQITQSLAQTDPMLDTQNEAGPNFQHTGTFTGEDERFSYKRAESRLWQMCGELWWHRREEGWWQPLDKEIRTWEASPKLKAEFNTLDKGATFPLQQDSNECTSPFRTSSEPPPKIPWTHAWGLIKWGKRAGPWGQGIDGLKNRGKDR